MRSLRPFNPDGTFVQQQEEGRKTLRRLAVRGAGATLFAGGASLAVQIAATIVLARILTPADFGVVAMVTTISLLLVNFGNNGLPEAIVQRQEIDHNLASSLFWISSSIGVLLTLLFAASGRLLAALYHDSLVTHVTEGISLTILVTSFSTVHLALLKRAMRFTAVSANDIIGRFVSVAVSIVLGLMGWGYWALVIGTVAQPLSIAIGAFWLCRWVPGAPKRAEGTGHAVKFALSTYGNFAVNYSSRNSDNLLVGWRFDARSLGFYKKAYDLFALTASQFVASLAIVVVAALSRVGKNSVLYRRYVLGALGTMAFVGMGLGAILTLVGKDLILLLLGPKWVPSGQIFTFFGPGIGMMILYCTNGWIHLSIGRPDRWFRWAIVEFAVTFSLFLVALHWGPVGMATAWSVSYWLLTIPSIWFAGRPIHLELKAILGVVWRYCAASIASSLVVFFTLSRIPWLAGMPGAAGALSRIGVTVLAAIPLYLATVAVLYGGFGPLYTLLGLLREMVESKWQREEDEPVDLPDRPREQGGPDDLPLVSILIPVYNSEEWIADTLRSALAQTWPRTEIIVVDDGSTDGTLAVLKQFEQLGVKVYTQKNQGASAARNHAFAQSHGDYIQWLDGDDLLGPDKISRQMILVMQGLGKRTLVSSTWGRFMYRISRTEFRPTALWGDLTPKEWLLRKMDQNIYMQTATWLVSRELTEAAGPWDIRLLGDDDGEYFCRVLLASEGVRFVPDAHVFYRCFRFDSLSYIGRFPQKIEAHWISMRLHIKYLLSLEDSPITRAACVQYLRDSMIYFYPESEHILEQANRIAVDLGEELGTPSLSWKYAWVKALFGWVAVKVVQHRVRRVRWRIAKEIDHLLLKLEMRMKRREFGSSNQGLTEDGNLQMVAVKESRP